MSTKAKKVVFSGLRPTGACHLGHLAGALRNWIKLQEEYQCYYSIVSWHAYSSEYVNSKMIKQYTFEVAADWLSIGLDPKKSVIFVQSDVKEHAELHLLLSMIVPLPWLERVPTFKEMKRELKDKDVNTYGFLGYPVLQTADIILYKGEVVPVGEDQAYHLELAREITRRFNRLYGEIFPEPQILLTEVPKLAGTDGRKMSKSFGNSIYLKDSPEIIREKIQPMMTDIRRKRRQDPGEPDDCPAFTLHKAFISQEKREELAKGCRTAGIGCLECKSVVIEKLIELLAPFWEKRKKFEENPDLVWSTLEKGRQKALQTAQKTMEEVRAAIGL
ncbi:MAG: tryptophan--tRNA ligase [Candidatus Aminicenantes bacterium]|nr:tryptophan--tRNA ligase [Candidatus Aminicenantes bacterium]